MSHGNFIVHFWKGRLYPVIKRGDGSWWLTNPEEKRRVQMNGKVIGVETLRIYFRPYQPFKKKSNYDRWKMG